LPLFKTSYWNYVRFNKKLGICAIIEFWRFAILIRSKVQKRCSTVPIEVFITEKSKSLAIHDITYEELIFYILILKQICFYDRPLHILIIRWSESINPLSWEKHILAHISDRKPNFISLVAKLYRQKNSIEVHRLEICFLSRLHTLIYWVKLTTHLSGILQERFLIAFLSHETIEIVLFRVYANVTRIIIDASYLAELKIYWFIIDFLNLNIIVAFHL
jgi:hypothetical protein